APASRCGCRRSGSTPWTTPARPTSPGSASWTRAASWTRRRSNPHPPLAASRRVPGTSREGASGSRRSTMTRLSDPFTLWRNIQQAGGRQAYIEQQLRERGFLVERRETTEGMSDRELDAYKKSLREEAAEKRRLEKEAWRAYKANHIVHLGEGVYWNDQPGKDRWDTPHAEERAAENELPPLDTPAQLAQAPRLTPPPPPWAGLPPRRAHGHPLPPFHHPQAQRQGAPHLGAAAQAQGRPALDPAPRRRETAGARRGPRLSAGPLHPDQRPGAHRRPR